MKKILLLLVVSAALFTGCIPLFGDRGFSVLDSEVVYLKAARHSAMVQYTLYRVDSWGIEERLIFSYENSSPPVIHFGYESPYNIRVNQWHQLDAKLENSDITLNKDISEFWFYISNKTGDDFYPYDAELEITTEQKEKLFAETEITVSMTNTKKSRFTRTYTVPEEFMQELRARFK